MNKERIEKEISEGKISSAVYFTTNGEGILYTQKYVEEIEKQNKRLNNIIDELEKWLEEQHQFIIELPAYTKEISIEHKTMELCYENILDKLQELKGSDK